MKEVVLLREMPEGIVGVHRAAVVAAGVLGAPGGTNPSRRESLLPGWHPSRADPAAMMKKTT